jgi:hypothetical protein
MKNAYLAFLIALVLLSCGHKSQSTDKNDTVAQQREDTVALIADTTKKIVGYTVEHPFSDPDLKDVFSINLYGKTILGGIVVVEIFDHTRKSIFKEKFVSEDLLGDMGDVLNDKQKLDTIKMRMKTFFANDRFHTPAIDGDLSFEMSYSATDDADKAEWEEVKKDRSSIAFFYNYGYEGTYAIAYNKKRHHTFLVFYSD